YIEEIAFVEGDFVEEGAMLFQIDPRPYQALQQAARAELARARSQFELAASEARRAEQLWERRAISREMLDQRKAALAAARAAMDAAAAELATAELNLQYTRVRAPISGRIGRAQVTVGNLASADTTVLTNIVSVDPLYVYFESDQSGAAAITSPIPGATIPVRVRNQAGSQQFAQGYLDFIDNRYDPQTGTLQLRALVDNADDLLRPGQFARVEMPVGESQHLLLIDDKAILADQERRYVWVVNEDQTVARRYVELGPHHNGSRVVTAGLQDGDTIVVNGLQRISAPGMAVAPRLVVRSPGSDLPRLADNR
ncbi:MAG: efflux RND transporter periplasmic adaptor subunit, partial [Spongiibacteraceae bacterium]|nr:efflux RND transporter periplasmic adaptor subunit [Spongiibacteraceae bacterium]